MASGLKRYEAEHDWLTTFRLPSYAPDLNPVEGIWSLLRRAMANTAFDTPDDLDRTLRRELRRVQIRPHLVDGRLTATALPSHHRPHTENLSNHDVRGGGARCRNDGQGSPANHSCFAARVSAVRLRGIPRRVA